jgi:alkaline phosphatase
LLSSICKFRPKRFHKIGPRSAVAFDKSELDSVDADATDFLLGLFARTHLDYVDEANTKQPSLKEMTEKAVRILKKSQVTRASLLLRPGGWVG